MIHKFQLHSSSIFHLRWWAKDNFNFLINWLKISTAESQLLIKAINFSRILYYYYMITRKYTAEDSKNNNNNNKAALTTKQLESTARILYRHSAILKTKIQIFLIEKSNWNDETASNANKISQETKYNISRKSTIPALYSWKSPGNDTHIYFSMTQENFCYPNNHKRWDPYDSSVILH